MIGNDRGLALGAGSALVGWEPRLLTDFLPDMRSGVSTVSVAVILTAMGLLAVPSCNYPARATETAITHGPMEAGEPWADANSVLVYRQRFENADAEGLQILAPA